MFALAACNDAPPDLVGTPLAAESTSTPAPTASPFPTLTETAEAEFVFETPQPILATPIPAWFEGIFVEIPENLARLNPSQTDNLIAGQLDQNLPAGQRTPDHNQFLIDGWPINNLTQQPRILAFPARDYASINVRAQLEIDLLKSYLLADQQLNTADKLPFLPITNQPQLFTAQAQQLPFQNGNGLRYVTLLANPENKLELLYVWQGLTADGRGVISAIFPIEISNPAQSTAALKEQVDALSATGFTPPLVELDQIISSITANLPEPELVFDENGKVDLTIVYPRNGGETLIGRQLELEGYVQPGAERQVDLSLSSGVNALAAQIVVSELDGWWRATLEIPPNVRGTARLSAKSGGQMVERFITLVDDPIASGTAIELLRPSAAETWVAGHPIYVEGAISGPLVDDTLTIGLLIDSCKTLVAKQSLTLLPEDSRWHGVLEIPQGVNGRGCIAASTGNYGEAGWREVQVPVTILGATPPAESPQIIIGNPVNRPLGAGLTTVFGTVFSPDSASLSVKILLQDGTLISEGTAVIAENNQWEFQFEIPEPASGRLFVETTLSDGDDELTANVVSLPLVAP